MRDLESCPFCGSVKGFAIHQSLLLKSKFCAHCLNCFSQGPAKYTPEEAEAAWNRREERTRSMRAGGFCSKCGFSLCYGHKFCPGCGARIIKGEEN